MHSSASKIKELAAINEMFVDSGAFQTSQRVRALENMAIEFASIIAEKNQELVDMAAKLEIAKQEIRILKERLSNELN